MHFNSKILKLQLFNKLSSLIKTFGFLMTIIPDKEYLEAKNFNAFRSSYKKVQKEFSGMIFYHTLDGEFIRGWRYTKGKVTKSISQIIGGSIDLNLKVSGIQKSSSSYQCDDYYYYIWSQDCTDYYANTENYIGTTCGPWYHDGRVYAYTECYYNYEGEYVFDVYETGEGGGAWVEPATPSFTVKAIAAFIYLDNDGIKIFNEALQNLLDKCGYNAMYSFLIQDGGAFNNVIISPNISGPANYDSQTGNLSFKSNSTISTSLQEEFVHLFQNSIYTGGIGQYSNTGHSNIEFEAKLIEDIICTINNMGCAYYGSTFSNNADYINWLYIVTNDGTTFPDINTLLVQHQECGGKNYWNFLNDFATNPDKPSYNFPVNSTLIPLGINYININPCE